MPFVLFFFFQEYGMACALAQNINNYLVVRMRTKLLHRRAGPDTVLNARKTKKRRNIFSIENCVLCDDCFWYMKICECREWNSRLPAVQSLCEEISVEMKIVTLQCFARCTCQQLAIFVNKIIKHEKQFSNSASPLSPFEASMYRCTCTTIFVPKTLDTLTYRTYNVQ